MMLTPTLSYSYQCTMLMSNVDSTIMKIDKNILIMSLFPERVISHFDETFNTFKLYEQENKEKYLKKLEKVLQMKKKL